MAEAQIEAIRKLKKHSLEVVLDELLRAERKERFADGSVEIDGPGDPDVPDGLRDNCAVLSSRAHTQVDEALLPTDPVTVWYSCKSKNDPGDEGKSSESWMDKLREELDPGKCWNKARDPKVDEEAARQRAKSRTTDAAIELYDHLARGGHYVIILAWGPGKLREFRRELIARLEWRLRVHKDEEFSLDAQIFIRDADYLKHASERLEQRLPSSIREQLGLDGASFWQTWEQWADKYSGERRRMDFVTDELRKDRLRELRDFMVQAQPDDRTIHIWGSPGVGKTRIVHELLGELDKVEARVRYTTDLAKVVTWLRERPSMASDAVFVVDEVDPASLRMTVRGPFNQASHAQPGARLIAVGPLHRAHAGDPPPLEIEPLADEQARELLRVELGDDERIERVSRLCEGFPLFILWLGKALSQNPQLLASPGAHATGGHPEWDACVGVLDSPNADQRLATVRAKSLLAALLIPEGRWHRLASDKQDELARALSTTWAELASEAAEVEQRGLLRRLPDGRVYVSPQNLERMLLNHFFSGPGPGLDPEPLRSWDSARFDRLLERANAVEASDRCKHALAMAHLRAVETCEDREAWAQWMSALLPASRVAPKQAGAAIDRAIARLGPGAILDTLHDRNRLLSSLAHLSHRALSPAAFAKVEGSLFELVSAAGSGHSQRPFGLWAQLFAPALHLTCQPFELRWELLRRRLEASDPAHRNIAVAALARALDSRRSSPSWAPGIDDIDGSWEHERLAASELLARLEHYWAELLARTEGDTSEAARQAVISAFRQGLRAGLSISGLELLSTEVARWDPDQRSDLAEVIADVQRYDEDVLAERGPEFRQAFDGLREALTPHSWAARLRAQVGSWHPGPWAIDAEERPELERHADEALARELVAEPELYAESVDWLLSERAVRAHGFAVALGRSDPSQRMLEPVCARVDDARGLEFATSYLFGWSRIIGSQQFDAWLDEARARLDPGLLIHALLKLWPNERRAALLAELLDDEPVAAAAFRGIAYRSSWPARAPLASVDALVELLAQRSEQELTREGVGLVAARLHRSTEDLSAETRAAIHELLDRVTSSPLPAIVELDWSKAVSRLARSGDLVPLRAAFERSLRDDRLNHPHHLVAALRKLKRSGIGDELWPLVSELLTSQPNLIRLAVTLHATRLLDTLSPELILDWVGEELERARMVALQLSLDADELHPIARALLERFGAQGPVARDLAANARGSGWRVLAGRALAWAEGANGAVQQWATQLEDELAREQREETLQLRYG